MNLDEISEFLSLETRLDELRTTYRAAKGVATRRARDEQKATLEEALVLNESLAEQIGTKLARMDAFRARLAAAAERCRELLTELDQAPVGVTRTPFGSSPQECGPGSGPWTTSRSSRVEPNTAGWAQCGSFLVPTLSDVPYDEDLAHRIRDLLSSERGLSERKMFGGLAFLIGGNMAIAASGQGGLLVRADPAESDRLVATGTASVAVMRGRPMPGWLRVAVRSGEDQAATSEMGHRR